MVQGHGEVDFRQRNMPVKNGEVLVTSGLDGKYPKGLACCPRAGRGAFRLYPVHGCFRYSRLSILTHLEEALLLEKNRR